MDIQEVVTDKHSGDREQLNVIFSEDKSIVVTAPAGCGKTTTMISKIAWELSSGHIAPNKKILAMTYSVAGAMKIRDSLKSLLPELVNNYEYYLNRVDVSNYHQFSMRLLNKYGYVLHENIKELYTFEIVDEESKILYTILTQTDQNVLCSFKEAVKNSDAEAIKKEITSYWEVIDNKLIPKKIITYNGILVAAIIMLLKHKEITEFYQKYYQMIIIDEFQDTNYLGYYFLKRLIGENRTVFMGDDIQRIYGFIGAVNNLFSFVKQKYKAKEFCFKTNYRFPKNPKLKELDTLFRDYGENYQPSSLTASVCFNSFNKDEQEVEFIADGISHILENTTDKAAVLVRAGYQGESIAKELDARKITYFNNLFRESDPEYEKFYTIAIEEFHKSTDNNKALSRNMNSCLKTILLRKNEVTTDPKRFFIFDSLYNLLEILFLQAKQWDCSPEERYNQIDFSLGNKGLKHMMEYMDERIVLSTIHSAKGLEWQYVIVPGLVSYSFPVSAICKDCRNIFSNCSQGYNYCKCRFDHGMEKIFKEEISVFYVALTRAKKNVFFTASNGNNPYGYPKKTSCILNLPGIVCEKYTWDSSF